MVKVTLLEPKNSDGIAMPSNQKSLTLEIAPCGWNPVAGGEAESPRSSLSSSNTDRPTGTPHIIGGKSLKWEPKSVVSEFHWKHRMACSW